MSRKTRLIIGIVAVPALAILGWSWLGRGARNSASQEAEVIRATTGTIRSVVATSGEVQPQNRLEIKPTIAGRIEQILVREGDHVRRGQTLAWMSSTERAALLDAARSQGNSNTAYWEDVYKATPVISPIDGEVIVRDVEPGQTIASGDAILVLSDRLIVEAQVDETDIGKIKLGQSAVLTLDAYPDIRVQATVDHIAYESEVVSNVTIYKVDLLPKTVPPVFRSGMSANAEVVIAEHEKALLLPVSAVQQERGLSYVGIWRGEGQKPERRRVTLGIQADQNVEVLEGIGPEDSILVKAQDLSYLKATPGKSNPFMPQRRRRQ